MRLETTVAPAHLADQILSAPSRDYWAVIATLADMCSETGEGIADVPHGERIKIAEWAEAVARAARGTL